MGRVVILLNHGLGDVLMALPLVRCYTAKLGHGERLLILVKSPTERDIVRNVCKGVKWLRVLCVGRMLSESRWGVMRLALWLRKNRPSLFLVPHASERIRTTLLAGIVRADTTIVPYSRINRLLFRRLVPKGRAHKVHYYMRFADMYSPEPSKAIDTRFEVPDTYLRRANSLLPEWKPTQTWIGLSPGSGPEESHKRWPISSYRLLAENLLNRDDEIQIAVFGSPSERDLVDELMGGLLPSRVAGIVQNDIMITAAAYRFCACIVAGCSGAVHLAAAVGTTVVGLYGPTNPSFTGPYTKNRRIVRAGLCCSPCYRVDFSRGCGNPVCLSGLDVGQVEREVLLALAGQFTVGSPWYKTTRARKPDLRICELSAGMELEDVQA